MSLSTEQVGRHNRGLVLRALRRLGPTTRGDLGQETGLARATVATIVSDLIDAGLALDTGSPPREDRPRDRPRGRPRQSVRLRSEAWLGLGLEVNVDYVAAVLLDLGGEVRLHESRPTGPGAGTQEEAALALAREVRERHLAPAARIVGVTVAAPALVRSDHRTVAWAPNLPVRGAGLAARLEEELGGCPVRVSNDANCAAVAELHHGAATGSTDAIYLTGTVGIGAGLVVDGRLVHGGVGFAGEVGHMPVGDPDAPCGCGRRGCWEASIGLQRVLRELDLPEAETPEEVARQLRQRAGSDPDVRRVLAAVGADVGLGVATLASVLDPQVVVLGGYFVPLGDLVLEPARRVLDERLASDVQVRPELRLSTLGLEAAALGAAEQSIAQVLDGDDPPATSFAG